MELEAKNRQLKLAEKKVVQQNMTIEELYGCVVAYQNQLKTWSSAIKKVKEDETAKYNLRSRGLRKITEGNREFAKVITNAANKTMINLRQVYPSTFMRTSQHKEWASTNFDGLERLFEVGDDNDLEGV